MKAHFINLFNYDRHSNLLLLPLIFEAGEPKKPVLLMAHMMAAQQIWLGRCKGLAAANNIVLWPSDVDAASLQQIIIDNHADWVDYLDNLEDDILHTIIEYKNLKGILFSSKLIDMFTQVTNHGTHHRAQIGQQLKLAGIKELPVTDYIAFTRL
ncbi:MAG: hypothetical protein EOP47_30485 [Sphingobacteriaceae bacterium]|nr:MAG: hypothetical protein EOP47_30485 [Sphingobacteriaceae bacterium]